MYVSRLAESAVAEQIQAFRGQTLSDQDFVRRDGARYALVALYDDAVEDVVDLDDPAELVRRALRPSDVATKVRDATQRMALSIFEEGVSGFLWWSTLEASWPNATLFADRVASTLRVAEGPEVLSTTHPAVRVAADVLGVRL
jgi:RES domain